MVYVAAAFALYVITITLLQDSKRQDVPATIVNIARELTNTSDVKFEYEFKVTGEPKIIVVVEVRKAAALERILGKIHGLGLLEIESKPVIRYRDFARELGVAEDRLRTRGRPLQREGLFFLRYTADYYGNTTYEYRAARRRSAEAVFNPNINEGNRGENIYKHLAERTQSLFVNTNDTASFDGRQLFETTLAKELGSNIHIISFALEFLEEYIADVTDISDY